MTSEQKLCLAILEQALDDWRVATTQLPLKFPTHGVRKAWKRQLEFWFTAPIREVGSFEWVCGSLYIDKSVIRSRVLSRTQIIAVKGRSFRRA